MRRLFAVFLLALATITWSFAARADDKDAHRLVAVLQYVAADYPEAVKTNSKAELDEQLSFLSEAKGIAAKINASFGPRIESIEARVGKGEDPVAVQKDCVALIEEIVRVTGIARAPKASPDLARGKTLFEQQCATCHGNDGSANTEMASKLDPKPASFREGPRIEGLTPFRVFNATMYGVKGTAMPPFPAIDEQDRWAIAFYVLSLRHACSSSSNVPRVSLERLATASDDELRAEHGTALGCLRTKLPSVDAGAQILFAKTAIKQAMQLAKSGDTAGARKLILDAYLSGVEPVEPLLKSRDPALVARLEEAFMAMRLAAERGSKDLDSEGARVLELLETAKRSGSKTTESSVFGLSFLIMLREGFEVVVVLGALLAVLKKTGAKQHTSAVHLGWIAALFVGALVFVFARKWVAGSNREWLEGVVAIVAVFMLLYAAFWLNARANTRKFMGEIRDQMKDAISRGGRVGAGLFAISFSSMLRESVETAIFLQGLAIDSFRATAWGAAAGLVVLLGVVFAMSRYGLKLPLRVLFDVSTILLFVTAVILLGKGIHALQEVGFIPLQPIPMIRIDILGLFPDLYGLVAQVLLACTPFVYRAVRKGDSGRAASESAA